MHDHSVQMRDFMCSMVNDFCHTPCVTACASDSTITCRLYAMRVFFSLEVPHNVISNNVINCLTLCLQ